MGILLGFLSAVGWGSADFFARGVTRQTGTYRTLLYMQVVGFVALGVYLLASGELARYAASTTGEDWLWGVIFAVLNMVSSLALYRSFEVGTSMSIVSPIASSYGAITVALSVLSGETLTVMRSLGIVLALAGVILTAINLQQRAPLASVSRKSVLSGGIGWALFAAGAYGLTFWLLGFRVTPALGGIVPVWIARTVTITVLVTVGLIIRQTVRPPLRAVWPVILAVGVLDTAAFIANAVGMTTEQVSIVTVLGSLFTAVTVLLAWIFLRERLALNQWLGVGLILTSLVLVSA